MKRLVAFILVLTLLGCDDDPTGPLPGVLEVALIGPDSQAGALLFHVEGGPVDSVTSARALLVSAPFTGVSRRVLVVGDLTGVVARVYVADVSVGYHMRVVEVADGQSYALMNSASFRLPFVTRRF